MSEMTDAEAARIRAVLACCEETVQNMIAEEDMTTHQADRLCAYSRTLSLRRIADALEQIVHNTMPGART